MRQLIFQRYESFKFSTLYNTSQDGSGVSIELRVCRSLAWLGVVCCCHD